MKDINYYKIYQELFMQMIEDRAFGAVDHYFIYCFNDRFRDKIKEIEDGKHGNEYRYKEY